MKRGNRGRKSSPKQSLNLPDLDNRKIGSPEELTLQRVQLAGTINGRLAAVRRLAYEAADSGESKGRRTSAFTLVTGSPLNRPKRSGRCLTRIRSRASGIERCSGFCWVAGYAGERRQSLRSHTFSDARIIGQSLT